MSWGRPARPSNIRLALPEDSRHAPVTVPLIAQQGFLFTYALTSTRLSLRFCRFLPLASVRLSRVRSLRRAAAGDFWERNRRGPTRLFRRWIWPYPLDMVGSVSSVTFMLETDSHTRVFVRLAPGIHYKLREAINAARVAEHGESAHSRPVNG
jgi:hypothetical protein